MPYGYNISPSKIHDKQSHSKLAGAKDLKSGMHDPLQQSIAKGIY